MTQTIAEFRELVECGLALYMPCGDCGSRLGVCERCLADIRRPETTSGPCFRSVQLELFDN